VNDSADTFGRHVWMSVLDASTGSISGLAPADILFGLWDLFALNITSGKADDVFVVDHNLNGGYFWPLAFFSSGGTNSFIWV
jgi:hypothetical protein